VTAEAISEDSNSRPRVLLVDDRPQNLTVLEQVLGDLELSLFTADGADQALRHLLHHDFAAILLDVQMPGIDGFETARLIRTRDRSRFTPIIFLTQFSRSRSQTSCAIGGTITGTLSEPSARLNDRIWFTSDLPRLPASMIVSR